MRATEPFIESSFATSARLFREEASMAGLVINNHASSPTPSYATTPLLLAAKHCHRWRMFKSVSDDNHRMMLACISLFAAYVK